MKELFTELYKKVLGFFQAQEKENDGGSNKVATNRLKLVLMQDRTNLTPYLLERMRGEMINVLSKYVEMDQDELELNFEQEGEQMALMLSIPVLRAKEEEEINAIIKAEEEAKAKAEQEASENAEDSEESLEESSNNSEKIEETDEDIEESVEEEVCACSIEDEEAEISESPDETEETEEAGVNDSSEKKSKKKRN